MEQKLIFGEKIDNLNYKIRKGVYAVIFNSTNDKVLTVQTSNGHYFLPGGGIEHNELHAECLKRERLEETGYEVVIGPFIGQAMRYFFSTKNEPLLSDGYFYLAKLLNKVQEPLEYNHYSKWIRVEHIEELLFHEHQVWAVKEGLKIK
ncbi:8-oxo-dGTP diphosphatase [Anoxybacillus calidus]|jgi:8-oxo-dGTP diphosphatase|uniref:8-oxo-dGTP diphosphatase n=1 Tax=[Anoxybacillus] calidus TaxID=575178 RepID=A0A7V9YY61_9BACL|nr:NUDIX domain-containing protein [Anoxybacillus calidus]MBA2870602.1 8-oxo-dGTP diphosphatase [Anoxybacillus calidus]